MYVYKNPLTEAKGCCLYFDSIAAVKLSVGIHNVHATRQQLIFSARTTLKVENKLDEKKLKEKKTEKTTTPIQHFVIGYVTQVFMLNFVALLPCIPNREYTFIKQ